MRAIESSVVCDFFSSGARPRGAQRMRSAVARGSGRVFCCPSRSISSEGFHFLFLKGGFCLFFRSASSSAVRWSFAPSSASYPHVSRGLSATKPLRSFEADEASRLILYNGNSRPFPRGRSSATPLRKFSLWFGKQGWFSVGQLQSQFRRRGLAGA